VGAMFDSLDWGLWLAGAVGIATLAAPWVFGFSELSRLTLNAVVVGIASVVLAAWALAQKHGPVEGLGQDRMAR
jgi:hypothetical protein